MRQVAFTFAQRVQLMGILDDATARDGGMEKILCIESLYGKIRFSDAEQKYLRFEDTPKGSFCKLVFPCGRCEDTTVEELVDGKFVCRGCGSTYPAKTYTRPNLDKLVDVEDAEARWAIKQMDIWEPNCHRRDLVWYTPLRESLAAKEVKLKRSK